METAATCLSVAMPHVLGLSGFSGKRASFNVPGVAINDVLGHFDDMISALN
jgi:hypothetical protein